MRLDEVWEVAVMPIAVRHAVVGVVEDGWVHVRLYPLWADLAWMCEDVVRDLLRAHLPVGVKSTVSAS